MNVRMKSVSLHNFKNVDRAEYLFNSDVVNIKGRNGAGKTTIATAFYWLFADKDYDLHSNPAVRKIGAEDLNPRVEVVFDIDGKEISFAKYQSRSVRKSKINATETVSLKNVYEVNGVECGEKDFKSRLENCGIYPDLFLSLSHPEVFTSKKTDEMRKVLFGMTKSISDYDVASLSGCVEVAKLLQDYTLDEIKAKQNSEIKKVREEYGKSGELILAKIRGLESAKVDSDIVDLENDRKTIEAEIKANLDKQVDLDKQFREFDEMSNRIMDCKFKQGDIKVRYHLELAENSREAETKVCEANIKLEGICDDINNCMMEIRANENAIGAAEKEIKICRDDWKRTVDTVFDQEQLICPMCKREFEESEKNRLISNFEEVKKAKIENITAKGNALRELIDTKKQHLNILGAKLSDLSKLKVDCEKEVTNAKEAYVSMLKPSNVEEGVEWIALQREIEEIEGKLKSFTSVSNIRAELVHEENELRAKLNNVMAEISKVKVNERIDSQIEEMKSYGVKCAQRIADAERILAQIDEINMFKCDALSAEINKNFNLVKFKLFDVQKNGELKEVCIPTIDGKDLNSATKTGLELQMKLDVLRGLQSFYKMHYPVFIDGAECLDSKSKKAINMDCQLIYLTVSDDELKVEV